MKTLCLVFVLFIAVVSSQDVKVPENLLDETTRAAVENTTLAEIKNAPEDTEYEDETTPLTLPDDGTQDGSEPAPDSLTATRDPFCDQPPVPHPTRPQPPILIPPIVNSTIDPFEREEIILCPVGFIQNGSVCVASYSNDCPEGYTWKSDRCVLSRTICPLNFEWNGRSCVEQQICPHNHVWKDGRCVQPEPECPDGWYWNGDRCEVEKIECQSGSVLRGNECVIESFACPSGFDKVGDDCVKPQPVCPPGYELKSSGFCSQVNIFCPPGSVLVNGECRRTVISCPPGTNQVGDQCFKIPDPITPPPFICPSGYYKVGGRCYPIPQTITTTEPMYWTEAITSEPPRLDPDSQVTSRPPTTARPTTVRPTQRPTYPPNNRPVRPVCPEGFSLYNDLCYRCPPDFDFCNMQCLRKTHSCSSYPQYPREELQDLPRNININIITREPGPRYAPGPGYNIFNNIEPVNNTIVNINNITHPVTLNNVNENNIYIYTDTQCPDGSIRTVIVKNNETINGCVDIDDEQLEKQTNGTDREPESAENKEPEKCCEIVTPRQCKKRDENQWICTHRRYKYCGKFCIADRLYLKPPSTSYDNKILTIVPSQNGTPVRPCFGRHCPPVGEYFDALKTIIHSNLIPF